MASAERPYRRELERWLDSDHRAPPKASGSRTQPATVDAARIDALIQAARTPNARPHIGSCRGRH